MITDCQRDEARLAPLRECMKTYGQEGSDPANEWPWNCLSRRTVAYSCGALRRNDELVSHNHDEAEFALCRRLAEEAATLMKDIPIGMCSEADDYFAPFFIVASLGAENPLTLNPDTVRAAFGGTIYPNAEISVETLQEQGRWWRDVVTDCEGKSEEEEEGEAGVEEYLRPWRSLIQWFHRQPAFQESAFVRIGDSPLDAVNGGCVHPRLAVGLTAAGSIAGITSSVVYT